MVLNFMRMSRAALLYLAISSFAMAAGDEELDSGKILYLEGTARKQTSGSEGWLTLQKGMTVEKGDSVATLEDSRLEIQFERNGIFRIGPLSTVFITDKGTKRLYYPELVSGDIWAVFSLKKDKNQRRLSRISLPTAEILSDSAVARFEAGTDCSTEIKVYDGKLRVERRHDYSGNGSSGDETIRPSPCVPDSSIPDSLSNREITLEAGQRLILSSGGLIVLRGAFGADDIDENTDWVRWNKDRDKAE